MRLSTFLKFLKGVEKENGGNINVMIEGEKDLNYDVTRAWNIHKRDIVVGYSLNEDTGRETKTLFIETNKIK